MNQGTRYVALFFSPRYSLTPELLEPACLPEATDEIMTIMTKCEHNHHNHNNHNHSHNHNNRVFTIYQMWLGREKNLIVALLVLKRTKRHNTRPIQDQYKTNTRPIQDQYKTNTRPIQDQYKTNTRPIQGQPMKGEQAG